MTVIYLRDAKKSRAENRPEKGNRRGNVAEIGFEIFVDGNLYMLAGSAAFPPVGEVLSIELLAARTYKPMARVRSPRLVLKAG